MKLLLTSGGITNKSIAQALFDLVGKPPEDTSLVFVPTAAHLEVGDKSWFINDLWNLKKQNFKQIDIADISAVEEKVWRPKLEAADVLFFEGGSTFHLMTWMNRSGLARLLPEMLKTKVYVGLSAGSMVTNPDLKKRIEWGLYEDPFDHIDDLPCLNLVDFYILPHLNSPWFKLRNRADIEKHLSGITKKIYVLDDQSAIKVVDGAVEVVSEGEWFVIN